MGDPNGPPLRAEEVFRALHAHGVSYVIVGGLAATAHGARRVTYDLDVVPEWTDDNLERLSGALQAIGAKLYRRGDSEPVDFPIDATSLRRFEVSTWRTRLGDIDVIIGTPTARRGHLARFEDLVGRADHREAFGVSVLVADLDDVIESKVAMSRESDLVALPELHRLREMLAEARDPSHEDGGAK